MQSDTIQCFLAYFGTRDKSTHMWNDAAVRVDDAAITFMSSAGEQLMVFPLSLVTSSTVKDERHNVGAFELSILFGDTNGSEVVLQPMGDSKEAVAAHNADMQRFSASLERLKGQAVSVNPPPASYTLQPPAIPFEQTAGYVSQSMKHGIWKLFIIMCIIGAMLMGLWQLSVQFNF